MPKPGSLRTVATQGLLVILAAKIVSIVLAQAAAILLPLWLDPVQFGILGIVYAFVGAIGLAGDFGLSTDLIRRSDDLNVAYETAFSIRTGLGFALLLAAIPAAYLAVVVYQDSRLFLATVLYAVTIPLAAFSLIPRVKATKALDFPRAVLPDQVGKAVVSGVSIALVALGFGYFGPIFGGILGTIVGSILFYKVVPWKPGWRLDPRMARSLVDFSKFVVVASFLAFAVSSLDKLLIGFLLGLTSLGYYLVAFSWAIGLPTSVAAVVSGVAYPIYGRVGPDSPDRLRRAYAETTRLFAYVGFFVSFGVVALAEPFVGVVLGARWQPTVLPMRILAFAGLLVGIAGLSNDLLNALGKSALVAEVQLIALIVIAAGLYFGTTMMGLPGASIAVVVTFGVLAGVSRYLARRELKPTAGLAWRKAFIPPSVAGAASLGTSFLLGTFLPIGLPGLIFQFFGYAGTYFAAMEILTNGSFLAELKGVGRLAIGRTRS